MPASVIICGSTCGHNHDSLNGPTGCCATHGPYMYFCYKCSEERKMKSQKIVVTCDNCEQVVAEGQEKAVTLSAEDHEWALDFCPSCYTKLFQFIGLPLDELACTECDYVARTKSGLRTHMTRKHG